MGMDKTSSYSQGALHELNTARAQNNPGDSGVLKSDDVFNSELAKEMVKRTDKLNDTSIELALRLKQAREFMDWSCNHIKSTWLDWYDESSKALRDVTQIRMAFEREGKTVCAAGKDVADFFNSSDYQNAHARLKELVSLLEAFNRFKGDGTLDAFADFILKVTCK